MEIAEISLTTRNHKILAAGEGETQVVALREALEHAELQAQRFRDRIRTRKRQAKAEEEPVAAPKKRSLRKAAKEEEEKEAKPPVARAPGRQTKAAITVHSFPGKPKVVEPHVLSAAEALAIRPMTIEEAVKEAEFRDKDLLVFRNLAGELFVLHRRRDGQMELAEIPL
jgi:putative sigma-54 modulation protein